jgi:hypothetical protein
MWSSPITVGRKKGGESLSNENFQFSNPLIAFLVRNVSFICDCMNTNRTINARKRMTTLINFLDPKIKEALKDDIAALKQGVHGKALSDSEYDRILNSIIDKLYEAGYFSPQHTFRRPK